MGLLHLLQHIDAKDLEKPLDADAAELMNKNYEEFRKVVQETIKGGKYSGRQFDNVHYVPKNKWGMRNERGGTTRLNLSWGIWLWMNTDINYLID